jgi:hypothetical protein
LISPFEQMVHSFLEMLPLFALVSLALLHADELAHPRWQWQMRDAGAGRWLLLTALLGGLAFVVEEWWRCRRRPPPRAAG